MSSTRKGTQCSARSKQSGERCRRFCPPGTTVCHYHGARIPGVVRKAKERVAQAEATRFLRTIDVVPVTNPLEELQAVAGRAKAFMGYVESKYLTTDQPEWLALAGRSMNEFARQLEVLAKLLPAGAVGQGAQVRSPDTIDRDLRLLAEQMQARADAADPRETLRWALEQVGALSAADRRALGFEEIVAELRADLEAKAPAKCMRCGEACSACASELLPPRALPPARPMEPVVEDAEIVEPAPPPRPADRHRGASESMSEPNWQDNLHAANSNLRRGG